MMHEPPSPGRVASRMMDRLGLGSPTPDPARVASRMMRTAGEVRFIKDKSGDASQWAWNDSGPQERKIAPDFAFNPRNTKPLAEVLRASVAALGHAMRAYTIFTKIKSADVSPDGSLGGKGYIQKISEMRRGYMNVVEALSAMTDTLYDEIRAPHWAAVSRQEDPEEKAEVAQIVDDALDIKKDPEGWAQDEEENMGDTPDADAKSPRKAPKKKNSKTAFLPPPKVSPSDFSYPRNLIQTVMTKMSRAPFTSCEPSRSKDTPFENNPAWVKDSLRSAGNLLDHISRPSQLNLIEAHLKQALAYIEHNAELKDTQESIVLEKCSSVAWGQLEGDIRFILANLYPKYRGDR